MDTITIPDTATIRERLAAKGMDAWIVEKLGARLGRHAGEEKYEIGLPVMVMLAVHDICADLPGMNGKTVAMGIDQKSVIECLKASVP